MCSTLNNSVRVETLTPKDSNTQKFGAIERPLGR